MLNKTLVEFELGQIVSVHRRTLTYRIIAILLCTFFLLIAIALNQPFGIKEGVICGPCAFGLLAIAFRIESKELVICKLGLAIGRNQKINTIKWDVINKLTIEYSYSKNLNTIFKVTLTPILGKEVSFDMNWKNRKPLIEVIGKLNEDERINRYSIVKTYYGI